MNVIAQSSIKVCTNIVHEYLFSQYNTIQYNIKLVTSAGLSSWGALCQTQMGGPCPLSLPCPYPCQGRI